MYLAGVLEYLAAELSRELESEEAEVIELGVGATKRSVGARELTVSIACEPPFRSGFVRRELAGSF